MTIDLKLFEDILSVPSTSGEERAMADTLAERLPFGGCDVLKEEVGDGTLNLLFDWSGTGKPSFVFCTHMDTVPPYIPPVISKVSKGDVLPDGKTALDDDTLIYGRGSCDAKGQIIAFHAACKELYSRGFRDFGLLVLAGEETGSFGAKAFTAKHGSAEESDGLLPFVLVGEPTDNHMVSASKGTKGFEILLRGKPCHSGYPERGESAVDKFVEIMTLLKTVEFPPDPVLGPTTWNVGKLFSDNPQNILSPELSFRLYFRTTFTTDALIYDKLCGICPKPSGSRPRCEIKVLGGDTPHEYFHDVEGIPSKPVAFGSDAPHLGSFRGKAICGPGSILTAHTDKEYVLLSDLEKAVRQDVEIFMKATKA